MLSMMHRHSLELDALQAPLIRFATVRNSGALVVTSVFGEVDSPLIEVHADNAMYAVAINEHFSVL